MITRNGLPTIPKQRMRFSIKFLAHYACLLLAILSAGMAMADAAPTFPVAAAQVDLAPFVEYIEDVGGKLTLADMNGEAASRFRQVAGTGDINLGYSDSTFWFRFSLAKGDGAGDQRLLEVAFFKLGHLAFYAPDRPPLVTGQDYPLSSRPWPHRFYVFPVTLASEPRYYYLQVRS